MESRKSGGTLIFSAGFESPVALEECHGRQVACRCIHISPVTLHVSHNRHITCTNKYLGVRWLRVGRDLFRGVENIEPDNYLRRGHVEYTVYCSRCKQTDVTSAIQDPWGLCDGPCLVIVFTSYRGECERHVSGDMGVVTGSRSGIFSTTTNTCEGWLLLTPIMHPLILLYRNLWMRSFIRWLLGYASAPRSVHITRGIDMLLVYMYTTR